MKHSSIELTTIEAFLKKKEAYGESKFFETKEKEI